MKRGVATSHHAPKFKYLPPKYFGASVPKRSQNFGIKMFIFITSEQI